MSDNVLEEVAEAIEELRATFSGSTVTVEPDGEGGAYVTVDPVSMGSKMNPSESWIGFQITHAYPDAQVYPHFVTPELKRLNGGELKAEDGFQRVNWRSEERPATQLSRASNHWNPNTDTATHKLIKVIDWLADQ